MKSFFNKIALIIFLSLLFVDVHCIHFRFLNLVSNPDQEHTQEAFRFLDAMLSPKNCSNIEYAVVEMGCGGGFAAHFQLAASKWILAASSLNYSIPVLIQGKINGYSEGKECSHVDNQWTCFFMPLSTCESEILRTGRKVDFNPKSNVFDDSLVPSAFSSHGFVFWWGVIQAKMYQLRPFVLEHIKEQSRIMDNGRGFPFGHPIAGLHVRHGDKKIDGFMEHSFESELGAIRKSPEFTQHSINSSNLLVEFHNNNNDVIENNFDSKNMTNNINNKKRKLRIYVASDDANVISSAKKMGFLVDRPGVSQQTQSKGMFVTLASHPELGFNASLEIITDIFFLSHCSTLIGIAASQVFRMATAISNVTSHGPGLKFAAVMDYDQIPKIQHLSRKYNVPFPETYNNAKS